MKMVKRIVLLTAAIIAAVLLCLCRWLFSSDSYSYYYVQIDNSKTAKLGSRNGVIDFNGGMELQYKLPAYNENGEEKEITFGTTRHLREGAYLKLSVAPIRGVVEWEEVQLEDMPPIVRGNFNNAL